jgi:hypothetical protein
MDFRTYDSERDFAAVCRIWREVGWLPPDDKTAEALVGELWKTERAYVALQGEEAECFVETADGSLRYLGEELPFSGVTGVATSRVARRQGLASRLTARAVAGEAEAGSLVCGLGCFEQGFYDRLGFGSGGYEHRLTFDPAQLLVPERPRPPVRLGPEHREQVRVARLARRRGHGSVNLDNPHVTALGSGPRDKAFGLGYFDGPGVTISHYVWLTTDQAEHGPYTVYHSAWQTGAQFHELLAVLAGLGDQVHAVGMQEPPGVQMQDLLRQPIKSANITAGGKYECAIHAGAYWQMRMLDLPGCLAQTHVCGPPVRFNLSLRDPIEPLLDDDHAWQGVGGDYVVTLGEESSAASGTDPALPALEASVGAFTRMWLGVRPATGLAITDDLHGPDDLLAALDGILRLPEPKPDWDF